MTQNPRHTTSTRSANLLWFLLLLALLRPLQAQHYTLVPTPGGKPQCWTMVGDTVFLMHGDVEDFTYQEVTRVTAYRMTDNGPEVFFNPVITTSQPWKGSVRRVGDRLAFHVTVVENHRDEIFAMDLQGNVLWRRVLGEDDYIYYGGLGISEELFAANEHGVMALWPEVISPSFRLGGLYFGWNGCLRRQILSEPYMSAYGAYLTTIGDRFVAISSDTVTVFDQNDTRSYPSPYPHGWVIAMDKQFNQNDLYMVVRQSGESRIERVRLGENDLSIMQHDTLATGLEFTTSGHQLKVLGPYCVFRADTFGAAVHIWEDHVSSEVIYVADDYVRGHCATEDAAFAYTYIGNNTHQAYLIRDDVSELINTYSIYAHVMFFIATPGVLQVLHYDSNHNRIEIEVEHYRQNTLSLPAISELSGFRCWPNPFNSSCRLHFVESTLCRSITVYNSLGQEVEVLQIPGGKTDLLWQPVQLSSGCYFMRLENGPTSRVVYLP